MSPSHQNLLYCKDMLPLCGHLEVLQEEDTKPVLSYKLNKLKQLYNYVTF